MSHDLKICLDKPVPEELQELAEKLSIAENPANKAKPATPFELAGDTRYLWAPGSMLNVRFLGGHPDICAKVEYYAYASHWCA